MPKNTARKTPAGIKFGNLVKDSITGFTGTAIRRTEFGYGCIHISIQACGLTANGETIPVQNFDDQRVEVLELPTKSWPKPRKTAIKLGDLVKDTLTGAVGIASGKTVEPDGEVRILVERPGVTRNGEPKPVLSIRAEHVVVVDKRELKVSKDSVATSGGPMARAPLGR
jgi:hypothetical protein